MRRLYNRAGAALIPNPVYPENGSKRVLRTNGRTDEFVIAFESVDALPRNDSDLTFSVCNRVKCRSSLQAGEGGGFHEVQPFPGCELTRGCGPCLRRPGVRP